MQQYSQINAYSDDRIVEYMRIGFVLSPLGMDSDQM